MILHAGFAMRALMQCPVPRAPSAIWERTTEDVEGKQGNWRHT